jgi:predicted RNA binding protein with dsRBD fold (UPF0201 family)
MFDPRKLTLKVQAAISGAVQLAKEEGHSSFGPLHVAVVMFEDMEGAMVAITVMGRVGYLSWRVSSRAGHAV